MNMCDKQNFLKDSAFFVEKNECGMRLDVFIASKCNYYSRSFFKQLIKSQSVFINKSVANKVSEKVKKGDTVVVVFPEKSTSTSFDKKSFPFQVRIIYEHRHFLIIDKPAGLLVHKPNHTSQEPTVVDWVLSCYKDISVVGCNDRPGIVHRLDKNTSGLLIIARTNYAHTVFGTLFHDRLIHKTYHALVSGHPEKTDTINLPIARDPFCRSRMKAFNHKETVQFAAKKYKMRASKSYYTVLNYYNDTALVEVKPLTGRTHQIRVHMKSQGHPLIGDVVYGSESKLIARHALHAYGLSFTFDGIAYAFSSDYPKDFALLIAKVAKTVN